MNDEKLHVFSSGRRGKTTLLISLTVLALVLFPKAIFSTCALFFGGVIVAFLLSPLARLYEKKFSVEKSAVFAFVSAIVGLALALLLLTPMMLRQITLLTQQLPSILVQIREACAPMLARINASMAKLLPELSKPSFLGDHITSIATNAMDYARIIADKIYQFALMAMLGCFLLADRRRILLRAELLLPLSQRKTILRHAGMLLGELKMYIRGQATIALCVGSIASFLLMLIGVPAGIALGAIVGILNMIPYFGPILGGIPAVLVALGESWQKALMTLAALILVQQIDGMVISPRVIGNATGFSPAAVLVALYTASELWGIAGLLFAMPMLMSIRTLYRVFAQRYEKN